MLLVLTFLILLFLEYNCSTDIFVTSEYDGRYYYEWEAINRSFIKKYPSTLIKNPIQPKFERESQCGQDIFILNALNNKRNGFYVDLAANHYKFFSNTYPLDALSNWTGVCIEPNREYLNELLMYRNCSVFINPVSGIANEKITFRLSGILGGIISNDTDNKPSDKFRNIEVTLITVTLVSILRHINAPQVIDYLSLDVEGNEYHILNKFDFSYTFLLLSIERPTKHLHFILTERGYWFLYTICTFGDLIYIHESHNNFTMIMKQYRFNSNANITIYNNQEHSFLLFPNWDENSMRNRRKLLV